MKLSSKILAVAFVVAMVFTVTTMVSAAGYEFTNSLTIGSTGADVVALQTALVSAGYLTMPAGVDMGYFGTITKAAVAKFQVAKGITPAVGYFGPVTRAAMNNAVGAGTVTATGALCPNGNTLASNCAVAPGAVAVALCPNGNTIASNCATAPSGTATGSSEGSLWHNSQLGDIESTLYEGDTAVKVDGVEFKAQDSNLTIDRVDVTFDVSASTGSTQLTKYISSASLMLNGTKIATMAASQASKDSKVYTMRFSGLNAQVAKDSTADLYVSVDAVSSVAANESGQTVTVAIPANGIRATDTSGVSDTYFSTAYGEGYSEGFSVSTATNGTLTISASTSNPAASQVKADASVVTNDVNLLAFNLKAKTQGATITDLPIGLTCTGTCATSGLKYMIERVRLMNGSTVLSTKTVSSTAASAPIVFDSIDQTIAQDATLGYTVVADIKALSANFAVGDTLIASTTKSVATWDAEDSNGNAISGSNLKGSALGGTITFKSTGVTVALASQTYATKTGLSGHGDTTQYTIAFTVTAGDDDLYIDKSVQKSLTPSSAGAGAGAGVAFATTTSSTASSTVVGAASTNLSADQSDVYASTDSANNFKINAGSSRTFTLNVSYTAAGTGYTGVMLTGINYDTTDSASDAQYFTSGLSTFHTADVQMQIE
jgi:hypothetical protein